MRAFRGVISPVTRGRRLVRRISLSMSRSMTMLVALAPAAARVPPTRVARISHAGGMPRSATTMAGTVVTRSSSMIRGLVRATYAAIRPRPGTGTGPVGTAAGTASVIAARDYGDGEERGKRGLPPAGCRRAAGRRGGGRGGGRGRGGERGKGGLPAGGLWGGGGGGGGGWWGGWGGGGGGGRGGGGAPPPASGAGSRGSGNRR